MATINEQRYGQGLDALIEKHHHGDHDSLTDIAAELKERTKGGVISNSMDCAPGGVYGGLASPLVLV